jgi:hypothetical protein
MEARYFKRRWEESRGEGFASWGGVTYYFEIGEDGRPTRQVEVYDSGVRLHYGPDHEEDEYGGLGDARVDDLEDWSPWAITREEFEQAWTAPE